MISRAQWNLIVVDPVRMGAPALFRIREPVLVLLLHFGVKLVFLCNLDHPSSILELVINSARLFEPFLTEPFTLLLANPLPSISFGVLVQPLGHDTRIMDMLGRERSGGILEMSMLLGLEGCTRLARVAKLVRNFGQSRSEI